MNVLIIDDDWLIAESLTTILENDSEISVIATGHDGTDAISLYKEFIPDILLMDIRMKHINGLDAAQYILSLFPDARILFLTTFLDEDYIIKAIKLGAKGYILKQNFASIIASVKAVYSGQNVFGSEIIEKIPDLMSTESKLDIGKYDLTEKEIEIITAIAEGLSNKEISDTLYLSEGTIRNYISIILEKLDLRDRTQIAIFYYKGKEK